MFTKKIIAITFLFVAPTVASWAQTTVAAPAQSATQKAEARGAPVATVQSDKQNQVVSNTTNVPAAKSAKKPVDQDKALWGTWLPVPELKFQGF